MDGVLACGRNGVQGIEPAKVQLLRKIVEATQCRVVVSSTWRKFEHSRNRVIKMLAGIGARLEGFTPEIQSQTEEGLWRATSRGEEIKAWLDANTHVTTFAILDDDEDLGELEKFLVLCDAIEGLTTRLADEVIRQLNGAH